LGPFAGLVSNPRDTLLHRIYFLRDLGHRCGGRRKAMDKREGKQKETGRTTNKNEVTIPL
jgi:hypothetical protein